MHILSNHTVQKHNYCCQHDTSLKHASIRHKLILHVVETIPGHLNGTIHALVIRIPRCWTFVELEASPGPFSVGIVCRLLVLACKRTASPGHTHGIVRVGGTAMLLGEGRSGGWLLWIRDQHRASIGISRSEKSIARIKLTDFFVSSFLSLYIFCLSS